MTDTVYNYRLWCNTESAFATVWDTATPTTCPNNAAHSIDSGSIAITDKVTTDLEKRDEDAFLWVVPNKFAKGQYQQYIGLGDDIPNGLRGEPDSATGYVQPFLISTTTQGKTSVEWQFLQLSYIAGGNCHVHLADEEDRINFEIYAPATAGTSNAGSGAYDKTSVGGGVNMFTPNATTEGNWDLNLTEKLNANVDFTKAVPVKAATAGTGYFNFNAATGALTAAPSGDGDYNLFDAAIPLASHVRWIAMTEGGVLSLEGSDLVATPVLPHWKYKVTIWKETDDSSEVCASWHLICGVYDPR